SVPRVRCPEHGVRLVSVPWARPGSGFTMLFEALVLTFAKAMPMKRVAAMVREHDTRVWRIVEHHVHTTRAGADFSDVARVGMDETSARKGQDYISLFADLDAGRVCFATEGRDADTVSEFAADLAAHGGDPKQVHTTSSDMSAAFIRGIGDALPNAQLTFDRYHLAAKLSEAVDAVRRAEVATRPELTHTRWLWLKNWSNLSVTQRGELQRLLRPSAQLATPTSPALARGLPRPSCDQHPSHAPDYLRSWCSGAKRSRLQPIKDFVALVERHWDGIIA
ncbi:MAG: ISL3 family transposase, partial [Actinomycetota bacterium]|nr:ISL3 family transposase [Actinomycetota bacterium]